MFKNLSKKKTENGIILVEENEITRLGNPEPKILLNPVRWKQRNKKILFRHIEPQQRPFKATDNYPGPPNVGGKMMGSVRCPSYSRAVRGLHNADRSPPPDYKSNRNGKSNKIKLSTIKNWGPGKIDWIESDLLKWFDHLTDWYWPFDSLTSPLHHFK